MEHMMSNRPRKVYVISWKEFKNNSIIDYGVYSVENDLDYAEELSLQLEQNATKIDKNIKCCVQLFMLAPIVKSKEE
jgi:hypothetical protein